MPNYFVSYDLNGSHPTHAEMDEHLEELGECVGRVLETVWYVKYSGELKELYDYVNSICSKNDRVLVIKARSCRYRNLLPKGSKKLDECWS